MAHPVHCVCRSWYMPNLVYAALSVNTYLWHGDMERDNETLYSPMMVEMSIRMRDEG